MGYGLNSRKSVNSCHFCRFLELFQCKILPRFWVYFLLLLGHILTQNLGKLSPAPQFDLSKEGAKDLKRNVPESETFLWDNTDIKLVLHFILL